MKRALKYSVHKDTEAGKEVPPAVRTKRGEISVVEYCLHGASGAAAPSLTPAHILETLRAGLPIGELEALQSSLAIPMEKLAPRLGISKATLHRRRLSGRLDPGESDRVMRFARLMSKAIEVLESEENARRWLNSPQVGLGGAVPLDYAELEMGAREVEDLLGRIEYGVYS
jgi:putative toxin-antitoxin system antitoxin component (TIGR02293 family)